MSIIFENAQWRVTDECVEAKQHSQALSSVTPWYEFAVERLTETTDRERQYYDWPVHMAEKAWVDIDLFIEAFGAALQAHKHRYEDDVDVEMLTASLLKAQHNARKRIADA